MSTKVTVFLVLSNCLSPLSCTCQFDFALWNTQESFEHFLSTVIYRKAILLYIFLLSSLECSGEILLAGVLVVIGEITVSFLSLLSYYTRHNKIDFYFTHSEGFMDSFQL